MGSTRPVLRTSRRTGASLWSEMGPVLWAKRTRARGARNDADYPNPSPHDHLLCCAAILALAQTPVRRVRDDSSTEPATIPQLGRQLNVGIMTADSSIKVWRFRRDEAAWLRCCRPGSTRAAPVPRSGQTVRTNRSIGCAGREWRAAASPCELSGRSACSSGARPHRTPPEPARRPTRPAEAPTSHHLWRPIYGRGSRLHRVGGLRSSKRTSGSSVCRHVLMARQA
jgi:hypothetical protein